VNSGLVVATRWASAGRSPLRALPAWQLCLLVGLLGLGVLAFLPRTAVLVRGPRA
jgi:hypothetical protein